MRRYGTESWELDALEPRVLTELISDEVDTLVDAAAWDEGQAYDRAERYRMGQVAAHWDNIVDRWDDVNDLLEGN